MVGERLKEKRKDAGLKQSELAEFLGISIHTVGSYEQNKSEPDDNLKVKTAKRLGTTLDYLLGSTDVEIPLNRKIITLPEDFPDEFTDEIRRYAKYLIQEYKTK